MSKLTLWDRICGNFFVRPGLKAHRLRPFSSNWRVSIVDWNEYLGGMSDAERENLSHLMNLIPAKDK